MSVILVPLLILSGIYILFAAHTAISAGSLINFLLLLLDKLISFASRFVARYLGSMSSSILVTGGAGYIGSHTVLQLLLGGYKVVVVDNLDNASEIALTRVQELAGEKGSNLTFHKVFLLVKIDAFLLSFVWVFLLF